MWDGMGVVVGAAIAIAAGSLVTTLTYHSAQGGELRELLPRDAAQLAAGCFGATVAALATYYLLRLHGHATLGTATLLEVVIVAPTLTWLVWRHPLRARLASWALTSVSRVAS
jgi:hypothetical protein